MQYIKVQWIHSLSNEPVLLYSELDQERYETRKVEVLADGSMGFAGPAVSPSSNSTRLSVEPLPINDVIAADPQFRLVEITKEEFEVVWSRRNRS